MSTVELVHGCYYWVRLYRDDGPWRIAGYFPSEKCMTTDNCWLLIGETDEYYDTEINEVGPEIIPPPEDQPRLVLDGPPYFEDDQECGYCQRPIGKPHETWCRQ